MVGWAHTIRYAAEAGGILALGAAVSCATNPDNTDADDSHVGDEVCGPCDLPNANSICTDQGCVLLACNPGFGDCDGVQENGCELDVTSDPDNCGACGEKCGYSCNEGTCFGAIDVDTGAGYTCSAWSDGIARCWGDNDGGQLGYGSWGYDTGTPSPVPVYGVSNATQVAARGSYACALLANGTVWCWGTRPYLSGMMLPAQMAGVTNAVAVHVGLRHACVRLPNGTVECWGSNSRGELGNGTTDMAWSPVPVSGISDAVQVSLGDWHSCALSVAGTVKCWGANDWGQLGDGTWGEGAEKMVPVPVTGLSDVTQISTSGTCTCARRSDSTVWCWGDVVPLAVTDGPPYDGTDKCTPTEIQELAGAQSISAGGGHACAVMSDGVVRCWGNNYYGMLGNGTIGGYYEPHEATNVVGLVSPVQLSLASAHSCARKANGSLWCWGVNRRGEVGDGTWGEANESRPVPVLVWP